MWGSIPLYVGSVGCIVGGITSSIGQSVCWSISRRVGWSVSCSIGSGVDRLRYFVFFLVPLQPLGRGDPGYDVAGEDALIFF
jgi:hypothetical protein